MERGEIRVDEFGRKFQTGRGIQTNRRRIVGRFVDFESPFVCGPAVQWGIRIVRFSEGDHCLLQFLALRTLRYLFGKLYTYRSWYLFGRNIYLAIYRSCKLLSCVYLIFILIGMYQTGNERGFGVGEKLQPSSAIHLFGRGVEIDFSVYAVYQRRIMAADTSTGCRKWKCTEYLRCTIPEDWIGNKNVGKNRVGGLTSDAVAITVVTITVVTVKTVADRAVAIKYYMAVLVVSYLDIFLVFSSPIGMQIWNASWSSQWESWKQFVLPGPITIWRRKRKPIVNKNHEIIWKKWFKTT